MIPPSHPIPCFFSCSLLLWWIHTVPYSKGKYTPYWSTFPSFTSYSLPLPPSHHSRPEPLPAAPPPLLPSPVPACLPLFLPVLPSGLPPPFLFFLLLLLFLLLSLLLLFTLLLQLRSHISHDGSSGPPTSPSYSRIRCSRSKKKKHTYCTRGRQIFMFSVKTCLLPPPLLILFLLWRAPNGLCLPPLSLTVSLSSHFLQPYFSLFLILLLHFSFIFFTFSPSLSLSLTLSFSYSVISK